MENEEFSGSTWDTPSTLPPMTEAKENEGDLMQMGVPSMLQLPHQPTTQYGAVITAESKQFTLAVIMVFLFVILGIIIVFAIVYVVKLRKRFLMCEEFAVLNQKHLEATASKLRPIVNPEGGKSSLLKNLNKHPQFNVLHEEDREGSEDSPPVKYKRKPKTKKEEEYIAAYTKLLNEETGTKPKKRKPVVEEES